MKELIVLRGIPASGKTTYARQLMKKYPNKYKRVNRDQLREMIDIGRYSETNEKMIKTIRDVVISEYLKEGYSVIADDTNLKQSDIDHFITLLEKVKREGAGDVKMIQTKINVRLEDAINRDKIRENPVGMNVIKGLYEKYGHIFDNLF